MRNLTGSYWIDVLVMMIIFAIIPTGVLTVYIYNTISGKLNEKKSKSSKKTNEKDPRVLRKSEKIFEEIFY
jgi:hypothetical protein